MNRFYRKITDRIRCWIYQLTGIDIIPSRQIEWYEGDDVVRKYNIGEGKKTRTVKYLRLQSILDCPDVHESYKEYLSLLKFAIFTNPDPDNIKKAELYFKLLESTEFGKKLVLCVTGETNQSLNDIIRETTFVDETDD